MSHSTDLITGYHAHVYYDEASHDRATRIREGVDAAFDVTLGRWRDQPVGPHPQAMYQVAFRADLFERVVPWLMLNHEGLDILVHPCTGDDVADHRDRAMWIGHSLPLDIGFLERLEK